MRNTSSPYDVGTLHLHVAQPDRLKVRVSRSAAITLTVGPVVFLFKTNEELNLFAESMIKQMREQLDLASCTV